MININLYVVSRNVFDDVYWFYDVNVSEISNSRVTTYEVVVGFGMVLKGVDVEIEEMSVEMYENIVNDVFLGGMKLKDMKRLFSDSRALFWFVWFR